MAQEQQFYIGKPMFKCPFCDAQVFVSFKVGVPVSYIMVECGDCGEQMEYSIREDK